MFLQLMIFSNVPDLKRKFAVVIKSSVLEMNFFKK